MAALLGACGGAVEEPALSTTDDAAYPRIEEWTPTACAVLRVANESSYETLDRDARLDSRAAEHIVRWRTRGTSDAADDRNFASLAELDSVSQVGRSAVDKLRRYADGHGISCSFPPLELQVLNVSDFHGQLDPVAVPMVGNIGGAAALSTYFARDRAANPNTLLLTAGDAFGATPPLSSFFEERPTVLAMNRMGFDADGLGNHNFDRGLAHFQEMARLAQFPYLSANLNNTERSLSCPGKPRRRCVAPYIIKEVNGVRVAIIGVTNPEAATLLKPGSLGDITVGHPVVGALRAKFAAEEAGAEVFIAIVHMGITGRVNGEPVGPLIDFARGLDGFDLVLGDHTNMELSTTINGALVLENRSTGVTYARTRIQFDRLTRAVVAKSSEFVSPLSDAVTPDENVVSILAPFRTQLSASFDTAVAIAPGVLERGNNVERLREMPIGNLVADSLRQRYGTQLGFTNGGGVRSAIPSSYAPANTNLRRPAAGYQAGPPYDVVIGDIYAVLPFGNSAVTRSVTGRQLWQMLEHSVEALPNANGWFGQISGFRFVFDSTKAVGSRLTSVALDDGTPIAADDTRYSLTTSDFIDAGGDGYAMLTGSDGTSREKMAEILLDHVRNLGTLVNTADGRITDQVRP